MNVDYYHTIRHPVTNEIRIKGSRFLGCAVPIHTQDQVEAIIKQQRQKYHDATHHCFAYRIGVGDDPYFRYYDDGEPSGTGGRPIYQAIVTRNLTNILIVVSRYFGGVKLGTGGLARAYGETAIALLNAATIVTEYFRANITVTFSYDLLNPIMQVINQTQNDVIESCYDSQITLRLSVRQSQVEVLRQKLIQAAGGKISIDIDSKQH